MATATIAKVRALLQDPDDGTPEISDADITSIIADEPDLYEGAALCAQAIAAKYAGKVDIKLGSLQKSASDLYKHWMGVAVMLRHSRQGSLAGAPELPGISKAAVAAVEANTDRVAPAFTAGQFDPPTFSL